jgi:putative flippase GtrA
MILKRLRCILMKIFSRWIKIGLTTKVIDFLSFALVFSLSKNIILANLLSASISFFYNFIGHSQYTFKLNNNSTKNALFRYAILSTSFFVIETTVLIVVSIFTSKIYSIKIISTLILSFCSYYLLKIWVYNTK